MWHFVLTSVSPLAILAPIFAWIFAPFHAGPSDNPGFLQTLESAPVHTDFSQCEPYLFFVISRSLFRPSKLENLSLNDLKTVQ